MVVALERPVVRTWRPLSQMNEQYRGDSAERAHASRHTTDLTGPARNGGRNSACSRVGDPNPMPASNFNCADVSRSLQTRLTFAFHP